LIIWLKYVWITVHRPGGIGSASLFTKLPLWKRHTYSTSQLAAGATGAGDAAGDAAVGVARALITNALLIAVMATRRTHFIIGKPFPSVNALLSYDTVFVNYEVMSQGFRPA
jgi:hypothetical protein